MTSRDRCNTACHVTAAAVWSRARRPAAGSAGACREVAVARVTQPFPPRPSPHSLDEYFRHPPALWPVQPGPAPRHIYVRRRGIQGPHCGGRGLCVNGELSICSIIVWNRLVFFFLLGMTRVLYIPHQPRLVNLENCFSDLWSRGHIDMFCTKTPETILGLVGCWWGHKHWFAFN